MLYNTYKVVIESPLFVDDIKQMLFIHIKVKLHLSTNIFVYVIFSTEWPVQTVKNQWPSGRFVLVNCLSKI